MKAPDWVPSLVSAGSPPLTTNPQGRGALALADVWACVKVLSDGISTLPVSVFRDTPAGRQPVGDAALIAQLLARPAPGATRCDLLAAIVNSILLHGEAFVAKYVAGGRIVQLAVLNPNAVSVQLRGNAIFYTAYLPGGSGVVETGPEDILHIRSSMTTEDGLRGLSPIAVARMALSVNAGLAASAKTFTDNGSRPSGVLTVRGSGAQSEYAVAQIEAQWSATNSGAAAAGKVAVLSGDVSFVPMALSQADAEFVAQRELSTREVCRIFSVPPWAIGAAEASSMTYSNVQQQARALVMYSFRPLIARVETAISSDPTLCPGGTCVRFELDELLRADPGERASFYTAALNAQTGWLSREEVRELEGLAPAAGTEGSGIADD